MLDLSLSLEDQERHGDDKMISQAQLARAIAGQLSGLSVPEAEAVLIFANRLATQRAIVRSGDPE